MHPEGREKGREGGGREREREWRGRKEERREEEKKEERREHNLVASLGHREEPVNKAMYRSV